MQIDSKSIRGSSFQFGTLTEEMIRDRLVIGILGKGTQARSIREKDLSLDKTFDMWKSSEITITNS